MILSIFINKNYLQKKYNMSIELLNKFNFEVLPNLLNRLSMDSRVLSIEIYTNDSMDKKIGFGSKVKIIKIDSNDINSYADLIDLKIVNKINSQKEINDLKIELQKTKEALEILQKQNILPTLIQPFVRAHFDKYKEEISKIQQESISEYLKNLKTSWEYHLKVNGIIDIFLMYEKK